jgi:CBS domain-containing protein
MATVSNTQSAYVELLATTKISSLIDKHHLVKTCFFDNVSTLLKKMKDEHVLAAVVMDEDPKVGVVGFVDVLDLVTFVIETSNRSGKDISEESTQNLKWEGQCFERTHTGHLVNLSRADPLNKISSTSSLYEAAKIFAKGIHRLAIINPDTPQSQISNVISQADIVHFITTHGAWLGTKLDQSLKSVGLAPIGVATVLEDVDVIATLHYMKEYKLSGVGIINQKAQLIGNFSATDLLGITADKFQYLALPVKEFLIKMHGFAKPPVCCLSTDTVESMLLKMMVHKVHRVYLVDPDMTPKGILTMTDIIQFLIAESV